MCCSYYLQNDDAHDFEALTRLLAYEHWGRMPHHEEDAQLLAAGLYLQLGMHNEAGERFARLLTNDVPTGVRNRAWLYLGADLVRPRLPRQGRQARCAG